MHKGGWILFIPDEGYPVTKWTVKGPDDINEHGCKYYKDARGFYSYADPLNRRFYYNSEKDEWTRLDVITMSTEAVQESDHYQRIELNERGWQEGQLRRHPFLAPDGEYWCFSPRTGDHGESNWEQWQKKSAKWERRRIPHGQHGVRFQAGRMADLQMQAEELVLKGHSKLHALERCETHHVTDQEQKAMRIFHESSKALDDLVHFHRTLLEQEVSTPSPDPKRLETEVKEEEEEEDQSWGSWGPGKRIIYERCRYDAIGRCSLGENCRFSHDSKAPQSGRWAKESDTPCKFFTVDRWCKMGNRCPFKH